MRSSNEPLGACSNTKYKFLSIVLEAPFTSINDIARKRYRIFPTKYLVKDKFDNFDKIDN